MVSPRYGFAPIHRIHDAVVHDYQPDFLTGHPLRRQTPSANALFGIPESEKFARTSMAIPSTRAAATTRPCMTDQEKIFSFPE